MYFSITNKKIVFLLFLILTASQFNYSQINKISIKNNDRKILLKIKNADRSEFKYIPKKPGHYTAQDWRKVIDSTWGEGLSTTKKLQLFDRFWNDVDAKYPSFFNLNVNWDSLKSVYRSEVEAGVSRGRFAAIMCRMYYALLDAHCQIKDVPVITDSLKPGIPIFVVNGYQSTIDRVNFNIEYCHFGASLSPLPDSSLLVYDVVPNHPLGLERGDIVLGYDGIPWKKLYKELLVDELPFSTIGSNPQSVTHLLLTSAGENWHLFDTIDVVKYKSGDTLHLPTSLLQNKKMKLLTTGQLPVAGVPFPDIDHGHFVSWGVIDGTSIGYIYVWNWTANGDFPYPTTSTGDDFRNAVNTLINRYKINGLIIDSRYNTGGPGGQYENGISTLFNEDQDIYQWFVRGNANDHSSMTQYNFPSDITGIHATRHLFDRPIAVLTGPMSASDGDLMPLQMRYHPMVRTFGLGTNGAFGDAKEIDISGTSPDWYYRLTYWNGKLKDDPSKYLTHLNILPDEKVWFTMESVVKGEDDVVNAALNWMNNLVYGHSLTKNSSYCHPGTDTLKISALVENPNSHKTSSKVYIKNLAGNFIDSLELNETGVSDSSEIWAGNYLAPDSDDFFSISLSAKDITRSKSWTTDNISRFTTIGPLTVDSINYKNDYSSGLLGIRAYVHNRNKTKTIKKVSVSIIAVDSLAYGQHGELKLPDLSPDTTVGTLPWLYISYDNSTFPGYFNLKFEIKSDGWTYWTDSTKVIVTGVNDKVSLPLTFNLEQNYPNPFNPSTTINYSIPKQSYVTLKVYDILGREVAALVNQEEPAGIYTVRFGVGQDSSPDISSGIYFYQIKAGDYVSTKKMILLK